MSLGESCGGLPDKVPDPLIGAVFGVCMTGVRVWSPLPAVSRMCFRCSLDSVRAALSQILFIIFMDRIRKCSQGVEGVRFGDLRIGSLLFADAVVLLALSVCVLQLSLEQFAV